MSHENVLPKAVREQTEAADALLKEMYGKEEEQPENPEPEEAKAEEPTPEPTPEPEEDHKYKVLKGKYDKEVPRLHRQLRDAQHANQQMMDRINKLEQQIQEKAKPKEPPAPALTQEEIDTFGPDLIDIIRRVAKQETGVVLDETLRPVKDSVKQVQETVATEKQNMAKSAREKLIDALDQKVPEWKKLNTDDDFLNWLDEEDPYAGRVRAELLTEAYENNDAPRVIKFFTGFQKENAVVTPTDEPSDETPEETESPEQPLDELVAPGTPKTGSAGAQKESGKKMWTNAEIQQFYAYKNEFIKKNPEKDLPEQVIAVEKDIFAAQSEGRLKP